jgi:pimeloyl-ACP methyl ester carboxylesterase
VKARESLVAAGVLAAGGTAGVLAERLLVRRQVRGGEPAVAFPTLEGTREETVTCSDGVKLAVYEAGPSTASLTVVFVHGYTVNADCWAIQVREFAGTGVRMVLYDHRGHGASEVGPAKDDTIEQLGRDLSEVLRQRVPEGPVLLVGHSMGGMTIMALAEQQPELFGRRIVGAALIDTSSAGMGEVCLGLPAALATPMNRLLPHAARAAPLNRRAERLRAADSDLARLINARVAFAPGAGAAAQAAMARMQAPMKLETMASFLPTFVTHDRTAALRALDEIPVVIMVGELDVLTPPSHSRVMADALPKARLITVPGSGHMLMMEAPEAVTEQLRSLIEPLLRNSVG